MWNNPLSLIFHQLLVQYCWCSTVAEPSFELAPARSGARTLSKENRWSDILLHVFKTPKNLSKEKEQKDLGSTSTGFEPLTYKYKKIKARISISGTSSISGATGQAPVNSFHPRWVKVPYFIPINPLFARYSHTRLLTTQFFIPIMLQTSRYCGMWNDSRDRLSCPS